MASADSHSLVIPLAVAASDDLEPSTLSSLVIQNALAVGVIDSMDAKPSDRPGAANAA
jgi:hypothetical protein